MKRKHPRLGLELLASIPFPRKIVAKLSAPIKQKLRALSVERNHYSVINYPRYETLHNDEMSTKKSNPSLVLTKCQRPLSEDQPHNRIIAKIILLTIQSQSSSYFQICLCRFSLNVCLSFFYPVGWGCRIHWLYLCRGVIPPTNEDPRYDTKQSDGEVPVMLELWEMQITPSLPLLPGPL